MAVNFYDLCRVCTANSEQKINIFSAEGKRKNLNVKVAECLALNIEEKDRLPKVVCAQCVQHIESNMDFRNICKKSQATLTTWLNSATGGKVYIKDEVAPGSGKSLSVLGNNIAKQIPLSVVQSLNQQPTILQSNDLLNSIIQVAGLQQQTVDTGQNNDKQPFQQYTITVDNKLAKTVTFDGNKLQQQQQQTHINEKDLKANALEEFLKLKPNIKVTPIKKDVQKPQQQQQQVTQNTPQQITIQAPQLPMQNTQQTTTPLPQQLTALQFQQLLQQQLQQQWQQQQLQQQLQQLTQLQPQQITITAPTASSLTTTTSANTTTTTAAIHNDALSPCKSKKPKINFVLTPPSTSQTTTATMLPQLTATTTATTTGQQPQIQLQFQPSMTSFQQNQSQQQQQQQHDLQQQQQSQTNAAALLSNLAPFLQQAVGVTTPMNASTSTTLLSPNKCFLPITIKDENSDQQIVAHIDAKNFVFPTTYQLQMKLQPQIATVDGQPIMQLTPTSIPATLQLTPQALTNQTFQALLNTTNNLQQTQMLHAQQPQQQQQQQQQLVQTQQNAQQIHQNQQQQPFSQPLITSQQIIRPANNNYISNITNDVATTKNVQQHEDNTIKPKTQTISKQKYKITQLPGNTIEITPAADFQPTQQQQQPTQQQQQQPMKQKSQQQLQAIASTTLPNSVPTQYGGITVQRISTAAKATTANKTTQQQQQNVTLSTTTPSTTTTSNANNAAKANVWNKQNVTISRVPVQAQAQSQPQPQPQQQQHQQQQKLSPNNKSPQQQATSNKIAIQTQNTQQQLTKQQQQPQQQQPQQHHQQQQEQATSSSNAAKKIIRRMPGKVMSVTKPAQQPQQQQQISTNPTTSTTSITTKVQLSPSGTTAKIETTTQPTPTPAAAAATATKTFKRESPNSSKTSSSGAGTSTITQDTNASSSSGFVCDQCQRVFKKKEHLTQHVKLHAGIRPFKCSLEGCDKNFSRKEHLLRHQVSHTGQKMFSCDVCQKPFSRKDNLNKHKRIHSISQNSSNYSCGACNKSFTVKAYFEEHMAMHIKQESTTEPPPKKKTNNNNHIAQRAATLQQQQQQPQPTQQIQIMQQQPQQQQNQQSQQQQQQIMHLQMPTVVTTQDLAGNTITITQSSDPNKAIGTHDATVLNLPSHLANFVQLGQTQFVNASTGQIVGHIKIDK